MADMRKQHTSSVEIFHLKGSWADVMLEELSPVSVCTLDEDLEDADRTTQSMGDVDDIDQSTQSVSTPEFAPSTPPTSEVTTDCLSTLLEWGCASPCHAPSIEQEMPHMPFLVPCAVMPLGQPWPVCHESQDACNAEVHAGSTEMPASPATPTVDLYPAQQFYVPVLVPLDDTSWQHGEDAMTQSQTAAWSLEAGSWDLYEAVVYSSFDATASQVYPEEGVWYDYMMNEMQDPLSWYNVGMWGAYPESHDGFSRRRRPKRDSHASDVSTAGQSQMGHSKVPRNIDIKSQYAGDGPEAEPITTLMIRNVPNRYTQVMLVAELVELGFKDSFDFAYLPIDRITRWNVGYAFVNFVSPELARKCTEQMQGYTFTRYKQRFGKAAVVSNAHMQGLQKNIDHYRFSAVQCDQVEGRRPRFFDAPWCAEFGAHPLNEMDWPLLGAA